MNFRATYQLLFFLVGIASIPVTAAAPVAAKGSSAVQKAAEAPVKDADFARKVGLYLREVCSSKDVKLHPKTPKLLRVIRSMNKNMPTDELMDAIEPIVLVDNTQFLGSQQQVLTEQETAYQKICSALLLSITIPLTTEVRKSILHVLKNIDEQIAYWQEMQSSQLYYFLHKSPHKWFSGKSQEKEIKENLKLLRAMQQDHYRLLGQVMLHVAAFDHTADFRCQYQWVCQYMSLVHQMTNGSPLEIEGCAAYGKLLRHIKILVTQVAKHEEHIAQHVLGKAQKPNYFARNWMRKSVEFAGIAAVSYLGWYYRNQLMKDYAKQLGVEEKDVLKEGYNRVKGIVLERKKGIEEALFGKDNTYDELKEQYKDALEDVVNMEFPLPDANNVSSGIRNNRVSNKIWGERKDPTRQIFANDPDFTVDKVNQMVNELDTSVIQMNVIQKLTTEMINYASNGSSTNVYNLNPILTQLSQLINVLLLSFRVDQHKIKQQYKLLIAIVSALPLLGITYGAAAGLYAGVKKLYRRFVPTADYEQLKIAFVDVQHLLNEYDELAPSDMRPEDYGKLLYFVYKLKLSKNVIPVALRERYSEDTTNLGRADCSIAQKMKHVELMEKTYNIFDDMQRAKNYSV